MRKIIQIVIVITLFGFLSYLIKIEIKITGKENQEKAQCMVDNHQEIDNFYWGCRKGFGNIPYCEDAALRKFNCIK